ncbi:NHLP leader peptide family RiPP precursor [Pannonibacter carbonis]|uniref:NHLP leader peptide family RiPP precursor n=1 Tax=Pannonibacter carbonis TaxID=2067569 RepID=UPI000D107C22|nr:NHLP leader peptide family RiPP precursor [Pannonibacter carbonis]
MSDFSKTMAIARDTIQRALIDKASEDAAFRQKLIDNPHAALRELLGNDPIPSVKIRVIEEQPGEVTLVLPRNIAEDELPDELLDLASGGISFSSFLPPGGFHGETSWKNLCPNK